MRLDLRQREQRRKLLLIAVIVCACGVARPQATAGLQPSVTRAMAGRSGTAVVIDVASSKILAAYRIETASRRLASPGSAIKPFTLLALLESGKVSESATLLCPGTLTVGQRNLTCTHPDLKQPLTPAAALAYSCNNYFAKMAQRLTPAELRASLLSDGFGSVSGLASDESAGNVALASNETDLALQAIGEWGLQVTPLEMLRAYQRLAQRASRHEPKLAPLFDGLEGAVAYGMANQAQPHAAMKVAGKTGTSVAENGPWRHAWFVGYAPAQAPQIALVVFLEKGSGPVDAAGVAQQIFAAYAAARNSHAAGASR